MKKNTNKKNQPGSIDSNTFLNTVLPSIKINQKAYPLNDFDKTTSKDDAPTKNPALKQT